LEIKAVLWLKKSFARRLHMNVPIPYATTVEENELI